MNRESIELEVLEQFFTKAVNELIERTADYVEAEEDLREAYKEIDELEGTIKEKDRKFIEINKEINKILELNATHILLEDKIWS